MTVRVRGGKPTIKVGPLSKSKEQMSAYVLVECESLDHAVSIAVTHPMAKLAIIEVRPVWGDLV